MESIRNQLKKLDIFIYNEYFDKYIELIDLNKFRKYEKYKVQKHHIIPRCYFKLHNLEVDESSNNKVFLLHKDHVLAHYYLALCSKDKQFRYNNELAISKIFGVSSFKASDTYEDDIKFIKSLEEYNNIMIECNTIKSENYRGRPAPNKGQKMSKETIAKRTASRAGYTHSAETRLKLSLSNKGKKHNTIFITNGIINKVIKIEDLPLYLEQGFIKGKTTFKSNPYKGKSLPEEWKEKLGAAARKRFENSAGTMLGKHLTEEQRKKCSEAHKGCRLMNKDGITTWIMKDSIELKLEEGWTFGRAK